MVEYKQDKKEFSEEAKITFAKSFVMLMPLAFLLHLGFSVIFYIKEVKLLFHYNVFISLIYLYISIILVRANILKAIFIVYFEVLIHAILCVALIGWNGGFYVYPLCMLPVCYFVTINFKKYIIGNIGVVIILLNYQICNIYSRYRIAPFEHLFKEENDLLYNLNTFSGSVILIFLLFSLLYEIRHIQTVLEKKNEMLKKMANYDSLTGIKNRRCMMEDLKEEIDKYNRDNVNFFIAIADIDNFKNFNDTYGHDCGDVILKEVANILMESTMKFDIEVSRWGGEEFLILIRYENKEDAKRICETILNEVRDFRLEYNEMKLNVTITIGCASFDKGGKNMDKVLNEADLNLYAGKSTTKNCVVIR